MIQNSPNLPNKYSDLPIMHKLIETYKIWQEFLPNFPKSSKYTLGEKIDRLFVEVLEFIFAATYLQSIKKFDCVNKASIKLDLLKFFLRIAWETKALNNKRYILISEKLDEIGKMLGGWIRLIKEKLPPETEERR